MSHRDDLERVTSMYDDFAHKVYAYALRHCGSNDADDVTSETFAIAWRRIDVVPAGAPLPWLLVTARHVIANRRRADSRGADLAARLSHLVDEEVAAPDALVAERHHVMEALQQLTEREREALLLVAWDGLDVVGAATVLKCSPRAFRARLARARVRLAAALREPPDGSNALVSALPAKGMAP